VARSIKQDKGRSSLPEVLEFMQTLWALVHGLERASKRMASTIGITGPQRLTLRVIGLFPGISAGELADVLRLHPSTLTGVLQRLVDRGLIARRAGRGDRRLALLGLTAAGRRANRNSRGTVEALISKALAECEEGELEGAQRVLSQVASRLDPESRRSSGARARPAAARPRPRPRRRK
jgi:DNA-binding MarR family transcriptional regulator